MLVKQGGNLGEGSEDSNASSSALNLRENVGESEANVISPLQAPPITNLERTAIEWVKTSVGEIKKEWDAGPMQFMDYVWGPWVTWAQLSQRRLNSKTSWLFYISVIFAVIAAAAFYQPQSIAKDLKGFLSDLKLSRYEEVLMKNGYELVDDLRIASEEDLTDAGITLKPHRLRILNKLHSPLPLDYQTIAILSLICSATTFSLQKPAVVHFVVASMALSMYCTGITCGLLAAFILAIAMILYCSLWILGLLYFDSTRQEGLKLWYCTLPVAWMTCTHRLQAYMEIYRGAGNENTLAMLPIEEQNE